MHRLHAPAATLCAALVLSVSGLPPARADVVASGANGFAVRHELRVARSAAAAYARLLRVQDWWGSEHTYSGSAANLTLQARPGGCWCERLAAGGFVRHMDVVYAAPGKGLRLVGGLGPLQTMGASGTLSFTLTAESADVTRVTLSYVVTGFAAGGFSEIAPAVDAVLGAAFARYGTPPAPPAG